MKIIIELEPEEVLKYQQAFMEAAGVSQAKLSEVMAKSFAEAAMKHGPELWMKMLTGGFLPKGPS